MHMKKLIIALAVVAILGGIGAYAFMHGFFTNEVAVVNPTPAPVVQPTGEQPPLAAPIVVSENKAETVVGTSVESRTITAYHYGSDEKAGAKELLFVGGAHGGYEWNSVLVAYQLMDYLKANPTSIPDGVRVTVIPVLNPDGLAKVVGTAGRFTEADVPTPIEKTIPGRYNANNVDLNRNFDCDWKATGVWQNTKVSGGGAAFSEPESKAFQAYVAAHKPDAVVEWFSSAGGVYSSHCGNAAILAETTAITKVYADAAGYPAHKNFDAYETSGDMTNWLAKNSIPAISVLLTNHNDTEWTKNQAGILALLKHFGPSR